MTLDPSKPLANARHERFALMVAQGEVSASEAYRECVSNRGTAKSSHERASALAGDVKVASRIEHLKGKLAEKAEKEFNLSKEQWLRRLEGISAKAEEVADFSAATGALDKIGKACAYYEPEKHELKIEVVIGGNADG